MIKIKAVDDENVLDVCELKTNQDDICAARERHSYCNAISIMCSMRCMPATLQRRYALLGNQRENPANTLPQSRLMVT